MRLKLNFISEQPSYLMWQDFCEVEWERMKRKSVQTNEVGLSPSAPVFVFEAFPKCKAFHENKAQMLVCNYSHANEARAQTNILKSLQIFFPHCCGSTLACTAGLSFSDGKIP